MNLEREKYQEIAQTTLFFFVIRGLNRREFGDARPARDTSRRARGEDVAGIISIDPVDLDERARDERGRHERHDEAEQGG